MEEKSKKEKTKERRRKKRREKKVGIVLKSQGRVGQ
jgi:hypothetical protein